MSEQQLLPPWDLRAAQIAKLFAHVPANPELPIVNMLEMGPAHVAVQSAAASLQREVVVLASDAPQETVKNAMAQALPAIVVCPTEVFGWVSKLAFLHGATAIYTCGAQQEGTLLDRASHF